jgi:hypothetical protein
MAGRWFGNRGLRACVVGRSELERFPKENGNTSLFPCQCWKGVKWMDLAS